MKRILASLPVLIGTVFFALSTIVDFQLRWLRPLSLAGLLLMALAVFLLKKQGELSPIHQGFFLSMILNATASFLLPAFSSHPKGINPLPVLYASLSAMALLPALFQKRYFTEYFARQTTPPEVWETDVFKKINCHMTWIWGALFIACFLLALVPDFFPQAKNLLGALTFGTFLPMGLLLGVGVPLNKKYPDYYQRKMGILPVTEKEPRIEKEKNMETKWTVVALNGSPHLGIGNTSLMIQMIKSALAPEGIDLEEVFLADKRIEYCTGCGVCMEKGKCWRLDDHRAITDRLLAADGIILASPVYFRHVTAQMKTFLDRSLAYGHKPRSTWKPGLAISVSAGMAECATADYLADLLKVFGAFSLGTFTSIAVSPGGFMGKEWVEARAEDLARDLARAIKEKRRVPATDKDLFFYLFMRDLVTREKEFMADDYRHWQDSGLLAGFEHYVKQDFTKLTVDPEIRKAWIREMISAEKGRVNDRTAQGNRPEPLPPPRGPQAAANCQELIKRMPLGFNKEAAGDLRAVYQFEISGAENFIAHLKIGDGQCLTLDGPHPNPGVIVKSPAEVWLAISRGELDGQNAFMTGKYQVQGDISLLMKLKRLFS